MDIFLSKILGWPSKGGSALHSTSRTVSLLSRGTGTSSCVRVWVCEYTVHWRALSVMFTGSNASTGQSNQSKHTQ